MRTTSTAQIVEAQARDVSDPSSCVFYHAIDLPSFGRQDGMWDLIGRFDDYVAGTDVSGRTVLDVGCATGFLTFEAEKRGATVTSFDAPGAEVIRELPLTKPE